MAIVETSILIRPDANTIFPGENTTVDESSPLPQMRAANAFTTSTTYSDDQLTKTVIRTWSNTIAFVESRLYSNNQNTTEFLNTLIEGGVTHEKTISFS